MEHTYIRVSMSDCTKHEWWQSKRRNSETGIKMAKRNEDTVSVDSNGVASRRLNSRKSKILNPTESSPFYAVLQFF